MWIPTVENNPEHFTDRARKVLALAQTLAQRAKQRFVTPEHLLLAVAQTEDGPGKIALRNLGIDLDRETKSLTRMATASCTENSESDPAPSAELNVLLNGLRAEASSRRHPYVGTEHFVLGILHCHASPAARFLTSRGVSVDQCQREIQAVLSGPRRGEVKPPRPWWKFL